MSASIQRKRDFANDGENFTNVQENLFTVVDHNANVSNKYALHFVSQSPIGSATVITVTSSSDLPAGRNPRFSRNMTNQPETNIFSLHAAKEASIYLIHGDVFKVGIVQQTVSRSDNLEGEKLPFNIVLAFGNRPVDVNFLGTFVI